MRYLFATIVCVFLSACASSGPVGLSPNVTLTDTSDLPPPTVDDFTADARPYLIGPFDKLAIDVFGVPELARKAQIDASGRLSFPLVGVIAASGMTPGQLAIAIENGLRGRYVKNPQVTVNLEETVSQVMTVDGQVARPGQFPVIGRMTLERAVARAGGTTEFAKLDDVVIFRTVNGQSYAGLYNLGAIRRGNYVDPEVYANDIIIVGDSKARRLFKDLLQVVPLLTTPLIVAVQR